MYKKQFLIHGILFFACCFGASLSHAVEPTSASVPAQENAGPVTGESAPGIDGAIKTAQQEVRDPFAVGEFEEIAGAPDVNPEQATPIPPLEGIGFGSVDGYAVMGGTVYLKGDVKNGIKLLEVRRREVDIIVDGGKVTLPLFPGDDVKKATDRAEKKSIQQDDAEG
jgi:hypothetical protein